MTEYDAIDRFNHWAMALLFVALAAVGWALYFKAFDQQLVSPIRDQHKAVGLLVGAFAIWRVGTRLVRGFPAPIAGTSSFMAGAARAIHFTLLTGVLVMPASGIAKSLFAGYPIKFFGLLTIGSAVAKNEFYQKLAGSIHLIAGAVISAAVCLHVLAALKHHFIDDDTTLIRMLR